MEEKIAQYLDKILELISRYSKIKYICVKEKCAMTADNLTVGGRRFRTHDDYEAAVRDQKKIDSIKSRANLNDPKQLYNLFKELQSGAYQFESPVGTDFDDEIYEKIEELKKQGITAENAGKAVKARKEKAKSKEKKLNKEKKTQKVKKTANFNDFDADMQKQILAELKKQEKKRRLIVALASVVAVLCFGYFGIYYFYSARTSMDYSQLASLKGSDALSATSQTSNNFSIHKTTVMLPDVLDEYKTLYEKNKRLIGWLKIDDTIIDYPVMQTSNNEYYLDHNFNQEYDKNGSLFLDCDCSIYPVSTNLIIYGHHMKNGSMFAGLEDYLSPEFRDAHPVVEFDTLEDYGDYEVMAIFTMSAADQNHPLYEWITGGTQEAFEEYVSYVKEHSVYKMGTDTGIDAKWGNHLLTLITCEYTHKDGRLIVVAKKIEE